MYRNLSYLRFCFVHDFCSCLAALGGHHVDASVSYPADQLPSAADSLPFEAE